MPQQLKQNKADKVHLGHGFGIFYIQSSNICDPKSYFSKKVIFLTESVAWLCAFPLKDCNIFEKSAVMVWNRPSMRIQFHKSMAPSANIFQHHFKLSSTYIYIYAHTHIYIYTYIYIYHVLLWSWHSLKWMFITCITIWNIVLQESASSLWKGCKISSDVKT